jgi:hypothetical protein
MSLAAFLRPRCRATEPAVAAALEAALETDTNFFSQTFCLKNDSSYSFFGVFLILLLLFGITNYTQLFLSLISVLEDLGFLASLMIVYTIYLSIYLL